MDKWRSRLFFTVIITVLVIGVAIYVLEWIFKIGNAQFSQLSDVVVCKEIIQPFGVSFEEVDLIAADSVSQLFLCGFLETDGRPARLLITVRNSDEALVYDQYAEYAPGNVQIPFGIPVEINDTYTIYVSKGRNILVKTQIMIADP